MDALRRSALACAALAALAGCGLNPPRFEEALIAGLPAQVELAQVPFFAQDQYQCGPAALATALQSSGVAVTPPDLTAQVYLPGKKGSLQVELVAATRLHDRVPYPPAAELPALLRQVAAGTPVVVMQNLALEILPRWHFAVLIGYDLQAGTLTLRSGTTRRAVVGMRRFMSTWNRAHRWALVVLEPDRLPADPMPDRYVAAVAGLEAVGRLQAAERAYARAREQWPDSVWPQLGLANLSHKRGELQTAQRGYLAALALDPNNVVAHNNLAEILVDRGCIAQARTHAERAAALAKGTSLEAAVATTTQHVASAKPTSASTSCPSQ
jgi:hypothetical protein